MRRPTQSPTLLTAAGPMFSTRSMNIPSSVESSGFTGVPPIPPQMLKPSGSCNCR